jgi:hypothetical protein
MGSGRNKIFCNTRPMIVLDFGIFKPLFLLFCSSATTIPSESYHHTQFFPSLKWLISSFQICSELICSMLESDVSSSLNTCLRLGDEDMFAFMYYNGPDMCRPLKLTLFVLACIPHRSLYSVLLILLSSSNR